MDEGERLPVLRGVPEQEPGLPNHLTGFVRDDNVSVTLTADPQTLTGGAQPQTVYFDARIDNSGVSQTELVWECSDLSLPFVEYMGNPFRYELTVPAGYTGTVTVTATLKANRNIRASASVTVSPADQPTGLTAVYGQTLADLALPSPWAWEDPSTTPVGLPGAQTFPAAYAGRPMGTLTVQVGKRPITVQADDKEKSVGEADPALTWSITAGQLVSGDALTFSLSYTGGGEGRYDIQIAADPSPALDRYEITLLKGTMTIRAAGGTSGGGGGGSSDSSRTLTDSATGVKVTGGGMDAAARLTVTADALHGAGDAGCGLLRAARGAGRLPGLWDVSLSLGFQGKVTVHLPVKGRDGDTLTVAHCEDGKLTLTDVKVSDWFYEAVRSVYHRALMNGTGTDVFSPNVGATRSMTAAILYRLEAEPSPIFLPTPTTPARWPGAQLRGWWAAMGTGCSARTTP